MPPQPEEAARLDHVPSTDGGGVIEGPYYPVGFKDDGTTRGSATG